MPAAADSTYKKGLSGEGPALGFAAGAELLGRLMFGVTGVNEVWSREPSLACARSSWEANTRYMIR